MRSLLFVPGSRPDRYQKASDSVADAYCIDLEDAVAPAQKEAARQSAMAYIAATASNCYLRINGLATQPGLEDLLALADAAKHNALPAGIVIPMVASAFELRQVLGVLRDGAAVKIIPMIETPEGLENLPAILEQGRGSIEAVAFGCADYTAAIGSELCWDALLSARSAIVIAASKYRLACIDGPYFDIHDHAGLRDESTRVASLGFSGKLAIHPGQLATINEAFQPSPEQVTWARTAIAAFEQAGGGVLSHDGMMIDQPVIDQARRILASENP